MPGCSGNNTIISIYGISMFTTTLTGRTVIPFIGFGRRGRSIVHNSEASVSHPSFRVGPVTHSGYVHVSGYMANLHCLYHCLKSQISNNGLIYFTSRPPFTRMFPLLPDLSRFSFYYVVAPYWDNIDLSVKGEVRYDVVTSSTNHPTLSCLLELTSDLIREEENVEFEASWLLVARWIDVCPFGDSNCVEVCD